MTLTSFSSFKTIFIATGLTLAAFVSHGQESTQTAAETFGQCIERLQQQARNAGVSQNTTVDILGKVKPLPKILGYDRSQPEFVQTFTGYFSNFFQIKFTF